MITVQAFISIALSLPEAVEDAHFENRSFKVSKKIFATLNQKENRATVKLSAIDQDVFSAFDKAMIYPVPNKWGKQGWTHINLLAVNEEILIAILKTAYCTIAPQKLAALVTFE